jgi:hypothetical protein
MSNLAVGVPIFGSEAPVREPFPEFVDDLQCTRVKKGKKNAWKYVTSGSLGDREEKPAGCHMRCVVLI